MAVETVENTKFPFGVRIFFIVMLGLKVETNCKRCGVGEQKSPFLFSFFHGKVGKSFFVVLFFFFHSSFPV